MRVISPYINFNGKCREAMNFYKECLGGELELGEVGGSPMEKNWISAQVKKKLKYIQTKLENVAFKLRDFRLTGRIGCQFNLAVPRILTGE